MTPVHHLGAGGKTARTLSCRRCSRVAQRRPSTEKPSISAAVDTVDTVDTVDGTTCICVWQRGKRGFPMNSVRNTPSTRLHRLQPRHSKGLRRHQTVYSPPPDRLQIGLGPDVGPGIEHVDRLRGRAAFAVGTVYSSIRTTTPLLEGRRDDDATSGRPQRW